MSRFAILCNLDSLEALIHEYAAENLNNDDHLLEQMRFGHFLIWLQRRQEMMTNGTKSDNKSGQPIQFPQRS